MNSFLFHSNEVHVKMTCKSLLALFLSLDQTGKQKRERKMLVPGDLLLSAWLQYRIQVLCSLFISEMYKWTLLFRRDNKRTNNNLQKVLLLEGEEGIKINNISYSNIQESSPGKIPFSSRKNTNPKVLACQDDARLLGDHESQELRSKASPNRYNGTEAATGQN